MGVPWVVQVHHLLGDHLPLDRPLEGVGEKADHVLLYLKLSGRLDVDHARDVGKLKLRKKSVENFQIFVYFFCIVWCRR